MFLPRSFIKLLLFVLLISGLIADESSLSEKILERIQDQFSHQGVLKHRDGFVYVDIDDEYIHSLNQLIITEAFEAPPYFGHSSLIGAHISVIYPGELNQYEVEKIEEYGQIIEFIPQSCEVAFPIKWKGIDEVYLVTVEALQLNCLREKYGLPPLEHAFHITIGVKFSKYDVDALSTNSRVFEDHNRARGRTQSYLVVVEAKEGPIYGKYRNNK